MQINLDEVEIVNNPDRSRFQSVIGRYLARIDYIQVDDTIVYTHTVVPEELGGQGVASKMARFVLDYARDNDLKVIPQCPFVAAYIKRHPEYQSLVKDSQS